MLKVDLHTHSKASPDGGISTDEYIKVIGESKLDYVAVTDHDTIKLASALHKTLGDKVIIGEEITCQEGELIGLFLDKEIKSGMSVLDTAKAIKKQGGLVYIPHPFETVRKGITKGALESIKELVDIVEVYNGRAYLQNKGPEATVWARLNDKVTAASSDAHGVKGLSTAFNILNKPPTASNLIEQLKTGQMNMQRPPVRTLLYPKAHRLRQKMTKKIKRLKR